MVALQGILDRTEVLGTDCQGKYNLLTGQFDTSKIILVRDFEQTNLIEDTRMPSFTEYLKSNRERTQVGDKILIVDLYQTKDDIEFIDVHHMNWRRNWITKPSTNKVYEVQEIKEFSGGKGYKILYQEQSYFRNEPKKKRTSCYLKDYEFINLSKTCKADLMFYLKDRRERRNYLYILPKVALALKYWRKEQQ